jgi:hypothetical protein
VALQAAYLDATTAKLHNGGANAPVRLILVSEPAEHFKDKKIRTTGTVKEVDQLPRIEIDDAKQIRIAGPPGG